MTGDDDDDYDDDDDDDDLLMTISVADDRWCIVSIWTGSDLSAERNGLEQIYQVPLRSPAPAPTQTISSPARHDDRNQKTLTHAQ